jgi:hypothetical protein
MSVIDNVGTIPSSINTGPRRDEALFHGGGARGQAQFLCIEPIGLPHSDLVSAQIVGAACGGTRTPLPPYRLRWSHQCATFVNLNVKR